MVTNLAAAAGVITAVGDDVLRRPSDRHRHGGQRRDRRASWPSRRPSGYVELWAAPIIGAVAGVIVVFGVLAIDKKIDDPVGALSAHGLAGIWGTLACGLFTAPRLAEKNAVGEGGLFYTGSFEQLFDQFARRRRRRSRSCSPAPSPPSALIKKTYGLRVSAEEEDAGLDISEHGMYGYPEQFIPAPELVGYAPAADAGHARHGARGHDP